ncbi:DUF11 domain-containing protein, partial [Candidatus Bipolaricaulota bacterium]|nr:DUF11 domain-containing protein [Candidatus Bipolaricaulota bacterium]
MRFEPERWGFLMPEWTPFEILIILLPEDEAASVPGQPGDGPGGDPGDDPGDGPGGDPGDDPGGDPGDSPGGDPGDGPGGDPGDYPGGDPRYPPGTNEEGPCCLPDGSCTTTIAGLCERLGGAFTVGGSCETIECPQPYGTPCAAVEGEITEICYTYERGVLKVYASYAIHNHGPVTANDITAYALVGLNDGVNGLGGKPDSQDWKYGIDIPAGGTYAYDVIFTATAPNLDLVNLSYLYGSLWLQVEAPWACWPITKQSFVQTWDPAPLCNPTNAGDPGTPPGGSDDGQPTGSVADVQISMKMVVPDQDPAAPGSQIQYNINVWQAGPATAENVVVELILPSSVAINASSGSAVQIAHRPPNDILQWDLGDLVTFPPGTSIWLQVDVDQDACGAIQYDFEVTSDTTDPDLSNNSGTLTTLIDPCGGEPGTPPGGRDSGTPGGEPSGGYDSTTPGACCLPIGSCESLAEAECLRRDGLFYGPGTDCSEIRCFPLEEPPCAIIRSRVTNACQLYRGPDQPMIVKADFELQNPGDKDALSVVVKLVAGVP